MKPMPAPRTSKPIMRFAGLIFMGTCAFAATPAQVSPSTVSPIQASQIQALPRPPIRFEPHVGRSAPASPAWSAHGLGYSLGFTADATLFRLGEQTLAL